MLYNFGIFICSLVATVIGIELFYPLYRQRFGIESYVVIVLLFTVILLLINYAWANPSDNRKKNEYRRSERKQ